MLAAGYLHDLVNFTVHLLPHSEPLDGIACQNCQQCSCTTRASNRPPAGRLECDAHLAEELTLQQKDTDDVFLQHSCTCFGKSDWQNMDAVLGKDRLCFWCVLRLLPDCTCMAAECSLLSAGMPNGMLLLTLEETHSKHLTSH